jgi:hypothetical protein
MAARQVPVTRVINLHRDRPPGEGYMYVGRPSEWGNPFVIGRDGDRANVIRLYTDMLRFRALGGKEWKGKLRGLKGKVLGCFCAPEPCHADILAKWADEIR